MVSSASLAASESSIVEYATWWPFTFAATALIVEVDVVP